MIEWQTMAYLATGCCGVMLFLRLVADDLELASLELDTLEEEEERKAQRRQEEPIDEVQTVQAV